MVSRSSSKPLYIIDILSFASIGYNFEYYLVTVRHDIKAQFMIRSLICDCASSFLACFGLAHVSGYDASHAMVVVTLNKYKEL